MQDPGEPARPEELPGNAPDELPVRGPDGPRGPPPATDTGIADLPRSKPNLNPGRIRYAAGDNVKLRFEMIA
jgi:hypothetical protein